jgi:putative peptide zinc metalloprotease protein
MEEERSDHAHPVDGDDSSPTAAQSQDHARSLTSDEDQPLTAAEFTAERMLRARSRPPSRGFPKAVYKMSGGLVNLGPSRAELREQELIARVKAPVTGCRRIVVISRKGGVGKSTTALMLGHTFASYRGDRVVALDGNPDAGSLGYRVRRETSETVTGLLRDRDKINRYADIRSYTSQASTRLEVIASDDNPRISHALGETEYKTVVALLERHYNLILLDTGTGILHSATRGFLNLADQLVLVMPPSLDGARASSLTFDWLDQHGYGSLVKGAVAVMNGVRNGGLVELGRVAEHFRRRCRAMVQIPWDAHLQAGAETALDELEDKTQNAYLDLAAAVADGFGVSWWLYPVPDVELD